MRDIDHDTKPASMSPRIFGEWLLSIKDYSPKKLLAEAQSIFTPLAGEDNLPEYSKACHVISALALSGHGFDALFTSEDVSAGKAGKKFLEALKNSFCDDETVEKQLSLATREYDDTEVATSSFERIGEEGKYWFNLKKTVFHLANADLSFAPLAQQLGLKRNASPQEVEKAFLNRVAKACCAEISFLVNEAQKKAEAEAAAAAAAAAKESVGRPASSTATPQAKGVSL